MREHSKSFTEEVWKNKWLYSITAIWFIIISLTNDAWDIPYVFGMIIGSFSISFIIMSVRYLIIRRKK